MNSQYATSCQATITGSEYEDERVVDMNRIWIVSELYYPEETSTGHYITHIAEALASHSDVRVICAQPTYSQRGVRAPENERHGGVRILRTKSTTFDKNRWLFKIINLVTVSFSLFAKTLTQIRPGDRVIVVTNPPLLPYLIALAAKLRRARYSLKIDDLYPEVLIAAGVLTPDSLVTTIWNSISCSLYRGAEKVFVLGRDMGSLIHRKVGDSDLTVITNWADEQDVLPVSKAHTRLIEESGLADKFVIQCAGNMGPLQGLECIVKAAASLADESSIHFTFVGSGRSEKSLRAKVLELCLANITFLGQRNRTEQSDFLNACDIAIVSLVEGMLGVAVPSRTYNLLAAGRPIIAVMDDCCEIAAMVRENEIGWVVPPGDSVFLASVIREAAHEPERLKAMGERARRLAESNFSRNRVLARYVKAFA